MNALSVSYEHGRLSHNEREKIWQHLSVEIDRIRTLSEHGYQTPYGFMNVPFDESLRTTVHELVVQKRALNPKAIVVIGIGGSALGIAAVYRALLGSYYNQHDPDICIYIADTVDTDQLWDIILLVEQQFERGNDVILNVISKSGTTLETVVNFQLFIELLKKYKGHHYHKYVVITTDRDSPLWHLAHEQQFSCLEIPHHIPGRYSVLSAVGLFPLAMLSIDIDALHAGASSLMPQMLSSDQEHNDAAVLAAHVAHHYGQSIAVHNSFIFSTDLENAGLWYRQLMAESIGKKRVDGARVGILPIVSIGSTDLHSVLQLYLAGPMTAFTSFVSVQHNASDLVVDESVPFANHTSCVQGKTCAQILAAIMHATQKVYVDHQLPFITIELPEKSAYYMGQWLQLHMLQTVYLGHLLRVNPFDQPQVELYKKETRKILTHE